MPTLAEIFRAGIQGVDRGQLEAARSFGMGRGSGHALHYIATSFQELYLPGTSVMNSITIIKESSIISVIGMVSNT